MGQIVTTDYKSQRSREKRTRKLRFYRGTENTRWLQDPCSYFHEGTDVPKSKGTEAEKHAPPKTALVNTRALIERLRRECSSEEPAVVSTSCNTNIPNINKNCLQASWVEIRDELQDGQEALHEPVWFHKQLTASGQVINLGALLESALDFSDEDEADEYLVLTKSKLRVRLAYLNGEKANEFKVTEQVLTKSDGGKQLWRTTLTCDDVTFTLLRNSHVTLKGVFKTLNSKSKWVKPNFALMFRNETLVGATSNLKGTYIREMTSNLRPLTWIMTFRIKKSAKKFINN